jgi:hypothetical protein
MWEAAVIHVRSAGWTEVPTTDAKSCLSVQGRHHDDLSQW